MSLANSTVLITGGAGFIGSHLVEDLARAGAKVRVFDNLSTGRAENLSNVMGSIELVRGDILDFAALLRATRGADFVSHQAAQLEIFRSTDNPYIDLQINAVGTLNVLRAAKQCSVGKVINASSACVYGQAEGPASEKQLPVPNWAYGVSKLAAERYASIFSSSHGLPVVSLRYSIVYGEREWYRRALTIFIKRVLQGQPPVVFGRGDQVRDFLYVGDLVRLHRVCLESGAADGEVFNAGTGVSTTIAQLARIVLNVAGLKQKPLLEDVAEGAYSRHVPDKRRNTAELKSMLLDCSKAERDLGWTAAVPLTEGVRREMDWASRNLERWARVEYSQGIP